MATSVMTDPLVACRDILLATTAVTALVDNRIYATPRLPVEHDCPCIRLTHIGSSDYASVTFRGALTAVVQVDVWAADLPTLASIREAALSALHTTAPIAGVAFVKPTSEAVDLDESLQPAMYRLRADLAVRIVMTVQE